MTDDALAAAWREQREELERAFARISELDGPAREDLFLRARRLLAVHVTLQRMLPAAGPRPAPSLEAEVAEAEELDHGSPAFARAAARIAAAHSGSLPPEPDLGDRVDLLPELDRARVAAALRLAEGEGDGYLGNTYAEMLAAAEEQLSDPDPAPRAD